MKYNVIVVLAGGIKDNGQLPESAKERIKVAKELFDAGSSSRILMSGKWSKSRENDLPLFTEAEAMVQYALSLGIPKKALYKEENSHDTLSNVHSVLHLFLKPNKWNKVIFVTSDFHLKRLKYIISALFPKSYTVQYATAKTSITNTKWFWWQMRENSWLISQWFFQYKS